MVAPGEDADWLRVGVASAMAKAEAQDAQSLVLSTLDFLQKAFPGRVQVKTQGFFSKKVIGFTVELGGRKLGLLIENQSVLAQRTLVSGGIALKTETISMHEWIQELIATLEDYASQNSANKAALQNLVGL